MRPSLLLLVALLLPGCASTNSTGTAPAATDASPGASALVPIAKVGYAFADPTAASSVAISVPANVTTLFVNVTFNPDSPAGVGVAQGIDVQVGSATCSLPDGPVTTTQSCRKNVPASGVSSIAFAGHGAASALVVVVGAA